MAFEYLKSKDVPPDKITIYRRGCTDSPTNRFSGQFRDCKLKTVDGGESDLMAAMSRDSDYEILWLRPGDGPDDEVMTAADVLDSRFSGPREALRLGSAKGIMEFMEAYDECV